jgi:hypothetical protein
MTEAEYKQWFMDAKRDQLGPARKALKAAERVEYRADQAMAKARARVVAAESATARARKEYDAAIRLLQTLAPDLATYRRWLNSK